MGNRSSPSGPPPPPKWQQVIAPTPPAEEKGEAPEPQSVLEIPEDRIDDPREQVEWFARLPEHAKQELRERWRGQEGARGDQLVRRKDTTQRWVLEGAGLFCGAVWLFQTNSPLGLTVATGIGAAIGLVAARVKPPPVPYGGVFALAYALFGAFSGNLAGIALTVFSSLIVFGAAAALAVTHRLQRFDGSEL